MAAAFFGLVVFGVVLAVPIVALVVALQNRKALRELRGRLDRLGEGAGVRVPGPSAEATAVQDLGMAVPGPAQGEAPPPGAEGVEPGAEGPPPEGPSAEPVEEPPAGAPPLPGAPSVRVGGALPGGAPSVAAAEAVGAGEEPAATWLEGGGEGERSADSGAPAAGGAGGGGLPSIEELLTGRLAIWLGAVALVLAVAFFVRYSIEQGWLGERVRVGLGVLFGAGLLVVGERMRERSGRVASGLSAAGIAALFVAFYAAVSLYGLVPAWAGFALLALTAAAGVALSLRHGLIVAVLGLAGGMLTPWLVETRSSDPRLLFGYLLLLDAAVTMVARRRSWHLLPLAALGGGFVWLLVWLEGPFAPWNAAWLAGFVVLSCLAYLATLPWRRTRPLPGADRLPTKVTAGVSLLLTALVIGAAGFRTSDWVVLAIVAAAVLALAFLREELVALAGLPPLVTAAVYLVWAWGDVDPGRALAVGASFGGGFALAGYAALWRWRRPELWATLSAASALVFGLLAWASVQEDIEARWGVAAVVLSALFAVAAVPVARRRKRLGGEAALAALAVAATTFAALAVPLELDREWLTVGWALEVALLVWLGDRLAVPALERLAFVLGALVTVRLVLNLSVVEYPIGELPVADWLLYGYGVPVAAFLWAAHRVRARAGPLELARLLEWSTLALVVVWSTLEVRHVFHPTLTGGEASFREVVSTVVLWQAIGVALVWLADRWPLSVVRAGGPLVASVGFGAAALGLGVAFDPLWTHDSVGAWPIVNWVLWGYGLTALLAGLAAVRTPLRGWRWSWTAVALGSGFAWLTLSVRQLFQGEYLDGGGVTQAEGYAYSMAWVAAGIVLLALGIRRASPLLRWTALGLFGLAAGKVFLYDLGNLGGLWRVLSFLGLGASLFLLAWIYQRFVREPGA